jgi:multidrug efflux pump subunit AcrB
MIAAFLYKNPRLLLLCVIVIVVVGLASLVVMPRLEDPVLGKRIGLVSTVFPGASAVRVESLVTIPLEQQLGGISQIKQVRSNSQTGISNIVIELGDEVVEVDPVWTLIRDRISDAKSELPESCFATELEVLPMKAYAAILAVKWRLDGEPNLSILRRLARELRADLIALPGTENVDVFGDPGEEYVAKISPTKLAALGISTAAIAQQITGDNANQPAGRLPTEGRSLPLELASDPQPIPRIANALIAYGTTGESTPLSTIATLEKRIVQPPSNLAIIGGKPAIVLGVMVDDQLRVDQWSDRMQQVVADFQPAFANEVIVETLFLQREHVDRRMVVLSRNLGIGTVAVMAVVLVLMGWRSMIVIAAALPLSALMVIAAMRGLAIPIHQMSVTGLIVALGLLIDNAIVMVDEVRARIFDGVSPVNAIVRSVRQLGMPLFGSTLTTALAFLPIATLPGPPGEFVGTIAVSVILAISASFLLSMTVIPALISLFPVDPAARGMLAYGLSSASLRKLYAYSLRIFFRFPIVGILLGMILPIWGFMVARNLPEQFFPPSDRAQIQIEVELSAADALQATAETVDAIRTQVSSYDQIDQQNWFVGGSAPTFYYNVVPRRRGTPFYAQAFIDLKDTRDVGTLVRQLQTDLDQRVPQARVIVRQLEQGPPIDAPIEVRIFGPDLATLHELGSELRVLLGQTASVIHTRSDLQESIPRLSLEIDQAAAKQAGLDKSQIAAQLFTTLEGASAGQVLEGDENLPVRVQLDLDGKWKLDRLAALPLQSITRGPLTDRRAAEGSPGSTSAVGHNTLASLANLKLESDVGSIVRIDGRRSNEVKAYLESEVLPSVVIDEFKRRLAAADFVLPSGYSLQYGGETEQRSEAVKRLIANGVMLFAVMLLTLVASFRSFRCALIVACVGGLTIGLGPAVLSWFSYPIGFMAIVGTMGLVGVGINDSIVVLAAIRANPLASEGNITQLVDVVSSSTRHIIVTTVTTIVGFTPLIITGGEFWPPLAITISGGVAGATFLALYFVPSLHLLLNPRRRMP